MENRECCLVRRSWANSNAMQPDVHNTRKRGKALPPALIELLVTEDPGSQYERGASPSPGRVQGGAAPYACSVRGAVPSARSPATAAGVPGGAWVLSLGRSMARCGWMARRLGK